MWERYCRGVNAIVYMVDAHDRDKMEASRNELHQLLDKPQLAGIPVLVLGNKRDLPGALDERDLIDQIKAQYLSSGHALGRLVRIQCIFGAGVCQTEENEARIQHVGGRRERTSYCEQCMSFD
ncbi:hypothetical protein V5799_023041 [Amblyomma americanum]|uniref:Uncharacterized protein n=1 Tax=Amblyomma americanum TaxID=6943 RepID=A0AAQ4FKW9_AMBAM